MSSYDRQAVHLCFIGEKTSLRPVLAPLATEFGADLMLFAGTPSITLLHELAQRSIADTRPLVILFFSDADPTEWNMPISTSRILQGLLALRESNLHMRLIRAALTPQQARDLGLPDSPLKETERRAGVWRQKMEIEQVEIDALATLRQDVLEQITREAVAPFFDADLASYVQEARDQWQEEARAKVDQALADRPQYGAIMETVWECHQTAIEASESLSDAVAELTGIVDETIACIELPELPTLSEGTLADDVPMPDALFDSSRTFSDSTKRLQAMRLHAGSTIEDDPAEAEEGEDDDDADEC